MRTQTETPMQTLYRTVLWGVATVVGVSGGSLLALVLWSFAVHTP